MQVAEGRQDLDAVREDLRQRQRRAPPSGPRWASARSLQRPAADVLHHDVADLLAGLRVGVLGEVVDLHDVRVVDLDQEPAFGDGRGHRVRIAGVDQSLEDDPAVGAGVADVAVPAEVDPAEAAVGERAEDLVALVDQVARLQRRDERERRPVARAEALGTAGLAVAAPADRFAAGRRTGATPALRVGRTAVVGSRSGTGGTATRLAPSRPRPRLPLAAAARGATGAAEPRCRRSDDPDAVTERRPRQRRRRTPPACAATVRLRRDAPTVGDDREPAGRRPASAEPDWTGMPDGALRPHSSQ